MCRQTGYLCGQHGLNPTGGVESRLYTRNISQFSRPRDERAGCLQASCPGVSVNSPSSSHSADSAGQNRTPAPRESPGAKAMEIPTFVALAGVVCRGRPSVIQAGCGQCPYSKHLSYCQRAGFLAPPAPAPAHYAIHLSSSAAQLRLEQFANRKSVSVALGVIYGFVFLVAFFSSSH